MLSNVIRGWQQMSPLRKVRRVVMVGLAIFGLWALTPYLYSRQVDEAFPAVAQPTAEAAMADTMAQPTAEAAMADTMAQPTAEAAMADTMAQPTAEAAIADTMAQPTAEAAMAEVTSTPVATGPVALSGGTFIAGSFPGDTASGKAAIFQLEDGSQVLRLEDFATTNGPDLFVVLSGSANPDAEGVKTGAFLELARLKGNQGNQNYELPADIDLSQYKSVAVWCRAFNIVFGYAALQTP
jgi:hypothetical protein